MAELETRRMGRTEMRPKSLGLGAAWLAQGSESCSPFPCFPTTIDAVVSSLSHLTDIIHCYLESHLATWVRLRDKRG